jgi:Trk K+ transport system NAD-binding subunit
VRSDGARGLVKQMVTTLTGLKTLLFSKKRSTTIIVGINALTRMLARELGTAGQVVSLIDLENGALAEAKAQDEFVLASAGAKGASCFMAATANDEWNLSLCRAARLQFRVPLVIARLGGLGGKRNWARLNDSGMVRMTCKEMVPAILGTVTPSNGLTRVATASECEEVADVELLTPVYLGRKIADLALDNCEVLALSRNNLWVADIDFAELRRGDVLTLIGNRAAINKVRESFTSL